MASSTSNTQSKGTNDRNDISGIIDKVVVQRDAIKPAVIPRRVVRIVKNTQQTPSVQPLESKTGKEVRETTTKIASLSLDSAPQARVTSLESSETKSGPSIHPSRAPRFDAQLNEWPSLDSSSKTSSSKWRTEQMETKDARDISTKRPEPARESSRDSVNRDRSDRNPRAPTTDDRRRRSPPPHASREPRDALPTKGGTIPGIPKILMLTRLRPGENPRGGDNRTWMIKSGSEIITRMTESLGFRTDFATKVTNAFRKEFGSLVFRRVRNVSVNDDNLIDVTHHVFKGEGPHFPSENGTIVYRNFFPQGISASEYDQHLCARYKYFQFVTSPSSLRSNDSYKGRLIQANSRAYAEPNVVSFALDRAPRDVPPRVKDLVAGHVVCREGKLEYVKWFVCSEMFFHLWSLLTETDKPPKAEKKPIVETTTEDDAEKEEPTQPSENKKSWADEIEEEEAEAIAASSPKTPASSPEIRKAPASPEVPAAPTSPKDTLKHMAFKNNYLMTNTYRKWTMAHTQNNVPMADADVAKRYWHLRCERAAIDHVHIYAAIALLSRWKELPTDDNVPNTQDSGPKLKKWDLPAGYLPLLAFHHANETR